MHEQRHSMREYLSQNPARQPERHQLERGRVRRGICHPQTAQNEQHETEDQKNQCNHRHFTGRSLPWYG